MTTSLVTTLTLCQNMSAGDSKTMSQLLSLRNKQNKYQFSLLNNRNTTAHRLNSSFMKNTSLKHKLNKSHQNSLFVDEGDEGKCPVISSLHSIVNFKLLIF